MANQLDQWWLSLGLEDFFYRVECPNAIVSAGFANSACTAGFSAGGELYMWGKIKNNGDDWMYPKRMMDLSMHHFDGADSSCISWGHAQCGELGYGPTVKNPSAAPIKVYILEGMHVLG
uniref:Uncharacterized protein n=1 Tax=Brassica oleracea TaxID=3712 RepID=A0A3P6FTR2_BRAOL|nr:unnamed protein product [Brassica oleracea]